jgi:hypothetical protein
MAGMSSESADQWTYDHREGAMAFFDRRNGWDKSALREREATGVLQFALNFRHAFRTAILGTANYETAFDNFVLATGRITPLQEAIAMIERHLNEWVRAILVRAALSREQSRNHRRSEMTEFQSEAVFFTRHH